MRVKTVQINWHDKLPIFSVDFDHGCQGSGSGAHGGWRFATGGGDNNVRIWLLRSPQGHGADGQSPTIEFLASLNRHTAPVNVVRFSPQGSRLASAGDDGVVIIWRQVDAAAAAGVSSAPTVGGLGDEEGKETWRPAAVLRGSLADICDLAWSPDGAYLASASVDNTARIWDARTARCVQVLADHSHYVQGVAWDPLAQFVATQSSDRSLRIYQWTAASGGNGGSSGGGGGGGEVRAGTDVARLAASHYSMAGNDGRTRLFHDDNLASFFRRPSVSPDGLLLAAAAGVHRGGNVCHVWARDRLRQAPVLRLPGMQRPVVAARWAPCEFDAAGRWVAGARRQVLAVASQSAVAVYDTACTTRAVGLMDGLHYAAITDLAWTADGSHLLIVSVDGFASVASLDHSAAALPLRATTAGAAEPQGAPQDEPLPHKPAGAEAVAGGGRRRIVPTLVGSL
ncbi:Chromatin assembly factor 1 subunit [Coemansia biformis]|uniref:Chromatin assembly factor 1 subunit n=1 Tax=Coemansia biformis TaxID=1286918 RepID=A0A9W8CZS9_9FUNG|nr:Chromatin assembly factor 1 subunit [Coemansia biformis]